MRIAGEIVANQDDVISFRAEGAVGFIADPDVSEGLSRCAAIGFQFEYLLTQNNDLRSVLAIALECRRQLYKKTDHGATEKAEKSGEEGGKVREKSGEKSGHPRLCPHVSESD
jgi:hypothetical protein